MQAGSQETWVRPAVRHTSLGLSFLHLQRKGLDSCPFEL